jgi:phosphoglycerate dehydrogenase-like enzyme
MKIKTAFFSDHEETLRKVYGKGRFEMVAELSDLYPSIVSMNTFEQHADALGEIEAIFSTWAMPRLAPAHLARLPRLKALFYGAGSVKGLAEAFLDRNIIVMSSWGANAVPVAEFALAQIILACKGYFRNIRDYTNPGAYGAAFRGRGLYGETIALIGAGMIGRMVIEHLKSFQVKILVVDPYLTTTEAQRLGVTPVSLEDAFRQAYVVSNHLPNLPELRGTLTRSHFASMRPDATFINTGRGAQIDEAGMLAILQARPDLTALLDVTDPEPPAADSMLFKLPNVRTTTHIAGSMNDEVVRMADYAIMEFKRWQAGEPLQYKVTREMLSRMA